MALARAENAAGHFWSGGTNLYTSKLAAVLSLICYLRHNGSDQKISCGKKTLAL
jgi:hypothetical protein